MPYERKAHRRYLGRAGLRNLHQRLRTWRGDPIPHLFSEDQLRFGDILKLLPQQPQRLRRQLPEPDEPFEPWEMRNVDHPQPTRPSGSVAEKIQQTREDQLVEQIMLHPDVDDRILA